MDQQPLLTIEDDEAAPGLVHSAQSTLMTPEKISAVVGVSLDDAEALLGSNPLETARKIGKSRNSNLVAPVAVGIEHTAGTQTKCDIQMIVYFYIQFFT